jgi:Family of unknown function (DUF5989)
MLPADKDEKNMGFVRSTGRRFGIAGELLFFFIGHRHWWMLPLIIAVLLVGVVIILAQSSALAPFLYPFF